MINNNEKDVAIKELAHALRRLFFEGDGDPEVLDLAEKTLAKYGFLHEETEEDK